MTPRLAFCFPAHASAAPLVRRAVLALRAQTAPPHLFECIVAADGGDPDGVLRAAVAPGSHPFPCRVVDSPRPGGDRPHRNHARNAAWRAAEAPICAMLDADFCVEAHFVEHLLHEHDAALDRRAPAIFTPVLVGFGGVGPADWLARSEAWAATGCPAACRTIVGPWEPIDHGIFSGFPDKHTPGRPASMRMRECPEGMPILWRGLLEALGGFDERFIGWGGDKEELVHRLRGLRDARCFDFRLLTSARAWHQPHARDAGQDAPDVRERWLLREQRTRDIRRRARWWVDTVKAIRPQMDAIVASARP